MPTMVPDVKDMLTFENEGFVDTEGILPRAQCYYDAGLHLCLVGPPGIGKTTLVLQLAGGADNVRTIIGGEMHLHDLVGGLRLQAEGTVWEDGPVVEAVERGLTLYADELTGFTDDCLRLLHSLLDFRKRLIISGNNRELTIHPNFRFISSCNLSPTGFDPLPREFRDRLAYIHVNRLDSKTEARLLCERFEITMEDAEYLVRFANVTRKADIRMGASTRQLEAAAVAISRGIPRLHAAMDCILSSISGSSVTQRDSLLNMIKSEGLELPAEWLSDEGQDSIVISKDDEVWS